MSWIFRVARSADWVRATAAGQYWVTGEASELDGPGFIRASTMEQVGDVANASYAGADDLVVLVIDPDRVESDVRYQPSPDSRHLSPCIYGPIRVEAVVGVMSLEPLPDGLFRFHLSEDALLALYLASDQGKGDDWGQP